MIFDNKKVCFIGWFEQIVKKEKARKISYVSLKKSFIVFMFFFCVPYRGKRLV